jgi:cyclic pyranopterin phosphate synthase
MKDRYGRTIDYLRVSVTDRCNLRCVYCMPADGVPSISHSDILSFEEIARICRCAAELGITKIKITGGEPLVRLGLTDLIREIKAVPGIESLTLTTNGILLAPMLPDLLDAGITGVNISLDTLDPQTFRALTRRDGLDQVLAAVDAAAASPIPVKINCVPMAANRRDLPALADLARTRPIAVRFIEMMPLGLGRNMAGLSQEAILNLLDLKGLMPSVETLGNGPAAYYSVPGWAGRIGFISALSHEFCADCNRIRLTADGILKSCLNEEGTLNVKELIRQGAGDAALSGALAQAILDKPCRHGFENQSASRVEKRQMAGIGG